jgi:TonB-linked SusC/RagA family outer membrane protein
MNKKHDRLLKVFLCAVFLIGSLGLSAQTVTKTFRNASLRSVLEEIKQQTKLSVIYNVDDVKSAGKVNATFKQTPVSTVLNEVLSGRNLTYTINGRMVTIHKSNATHQQVQQNTSKGAKRTVKGQVLDENGDPIIGATIRVKGEKDATVTDIDGNFTINAANGAELEVSYLGYEPKIVTANGTNLEVRMSQNTQALNEVVVTALGIKKEAKALSYNVQQLNGDDITGVKDANFMNALAGKVAGVEINSSAAGIGGGVKVVMRGNKSINGNNNALYVIDGIPMPSLSSNQPTDAYHGDAQTGDAASMVNSDDIASISVLSGAAASALYGSDAANGVIMITTKKGQVGKAHVTYSNNTSFFSPFVTPDFQNTYGQTSNGSFSSWGTKLATPSSYDPMDFFQTGYNTQNSVSLSVGSKNSQTFVSAASTNAEGIVENNTLARYNFSVRNTTDFLDNKLHLDVSAMYMKITEKNMISQGLYFNPIVPIYLFPAGEDIRKYMPYEQYDQERNFKTMFWPFGNQGLSMMNPYWEINRDLSINHKDRYILSGGLTYNIMKGLSLAGRAKIDKTNGLYEKKYYASTDPLFAGQYGAYFRTNDDTRQLYGDFILNLDRYWGDFSFTANLGTSIKDVEASYTYNGGFLNGVPNSFTLNNVNRSTAHMDQDPALNYHHQVQSVFGTLQVGFQSKVYLDLTARNDWDSFLGNTKYKNDGFFYPSVGLSTILTEAIPGLKSNVLSFLKLRGSYSEVGNSPEKYYALLRYSYKNATPSTTSYFPNRDLKPERTKAWEIGLQANLWQDKINLNVSLYSTQTRNQFFLPELSATSGYSALPINGGRVDNKGIEASLTVNQPLGPVKWASTLTYTLNRNKIKKLLAPTQITLDNGNVVNVSQDAIDMMNLGPVKVRLTEGGSMGDLYVTDLKRDEHGYVIVDYTSRQISGLDEGKYVYAGNVNPKYNIGWRNSFSWKGISLDVLVNGRFGGRVSSITQGYMDYFGASQATADARDAGGALVNGVRIPAQDFYQKVGPSIGCYYIYKATNIRLAELSVGYDVPVNRWVPWIQNVHVAFTGRNLLMFYCKAPFDPELTASTGTYFTGIDNFMMPSLRNLGFSVKVDF